MTKIHPLTLPITFGIDVKLLPHAKVSSATIFQAYTGWVQHLTAV